MVIQKKIQGEGTVPGNRRESLAPSISKKETTGDSRAIGPNMAKPQIGSRLGFRTDAAISNPRSGPERMLRPWVPEFPESDDHTDGSLEATASTGPYWDQFAENERLFGLKTDYHENIYTTAIDKTHPQYTERIVAAEKKAREIERSLPVTAHVAEERVIDFVGSANRDAGKNEEERYSGVYRNDFPPLTGRDNKYTPPAKRMAAAQAAIPADPAIISSQLKSSKKHPTHKLETNRHSISTTTAPLPAIPRGSITAGLPYVQPAADQIKPELSAKSSDTAAGLIAGPKSSGPNPSQKPHAAVPIEASTSVSEKPVTPLGPSPAPARNQTSEVKGTTASGAASTMERDILDKFRSFASQQRINAEKARSNKAKADKETKITELRKFADSFKLSTPVPTDLISIIAKDPEKQKEIQAKALQNAADVKKAKADAASKGKESEVLKEPPAKLPESVPAPVTTEAKTSKPNASTPPSGTSSRNSAGRQSYGPSSYHPQQYRNDRQNQHGPAARSGTLSQRLRHHEVQKLGQPLLHPLPVNTVPAYEMRLLAGPAAANLDPGFNRRLSGIPAHLNGKLNPNSHEFRPNPFASTFSPNGHPSAGSSPLSAVNQISDMVQTSLYPPTPLIRRKTKAVDSRKCSILAHLKTILPPQGRNWDENDGLRPSYDTLPTWKQLQDDEKPDSIMHLTYKQFFERQPFSSTALATPITTPSVPHMAHQHQLPFHLQQGSPHGISMPRQSPSISALQMQTPQHMHISHASHFSNGEEHRMMHSNSAQSAFGSPGPPFATVIPPNQVPYSQPTMVAQYRNFPPQYLASSHGPPGTAPGTAVTSPLMMQHQFLHGQPVGQPVSLYSTVPQYVPSTPAPPPPNHLANVPNGYASPSRPASLMMAHQGSQQGHHAYQGSQQGQPAYGLSPSMAYQQPVGFVPHNAMQMNNMRSFTVGGPHPFGTSPQHVHHYGPMHRGGYAVKHHGHGGQIGYPPHGVPPVHHGRGSDGLDDGK